MANMVNNKHANNNNLALKLTEVQKVIGFICIIATLFSLLVFQNTTYFILFNVFIVFLMYGSHFFFETLKKQFNLQNTEEQKSQTDFINQLQWGYTFCLGFVCIMGLYFRLTGN